MNIEQYKNKFFNLMESTIGDAKPLISEQATQVTGITQDDKAELIKVLRNHLNQAENDNIDAIGLAQVIYNDCAHFMNKTDIFKNRQGNTLSTRVPFAPEK